MDTGNIDIYGYERIYKTAIERIKKTDGILPVNRKLLVSFGETCKQRVSLPCVVRYLVAITKFATSMNKSFEKIKLEDVIKLFNMLDFGEIGKNNGERYSPETIRDNKVGMIQFLKFLEKEDITDKIVVKSPRMKPPNPALLWDEKELFKLINSAKDDIENQALISLMAETGCRVGEVGSMRIENVILSNPDLKDGEILVQVSGKTGSRSILLIWSTEYLRRWLNIHPCKDDPKSPLWIRKKDGKWIHKKYPSLRLIFRKAVEASRVSKPSNPHIFRKSVTTILRRKKFDEVLIKKRMGWSRSSRVIEVYDSVLDNDVFSEERRVNGVIESVKQITPTMRQCPHCFAQNPFGIDKCHNCGENVNISQLMKESAERYEDMEKKFSVMTHNFKELFKLFCDKKPDLTPEQLEKLKKTTISTLELS